MHLTISCTVGWEVVLEYIVAIFVRQGALRKKKLQQKHLSCYNIMWPYLQSLRVGLPKNENTIQTKGHFQKIMKIVANKNFQLYSIRLGCRPLLSCYCHDVQMVNVKL